MKLKRLLLLLVIVLIPLSCVSLPAPPAATFTAAPAATVPLELCWVETGGTSVWGALGAAGVVDASTWEVTTSALLVRHPKGDLLIDTGISVAAATEVRELGAWRSFVFSQTAGRNDQRGTLKAKLEQLGATNPLAIIVSHAHADHLGGVSQVPGVPVWFARKELAFVEAELKSGRGVVMPAQARAVEKRAVALEFESGPYLNYPASHDVFGDGSVVIVPTPGHTPGSVATFVNQPGLRLVHTGDLINLAESIERAVPKSWLMRAFTDEDTKATDLEVARLVQLHQLEPGLTILPAHDRRAWEAVFGNTPVGAAPPCVKREAR